MPRYNRSNKLDLLRGDYGLVEKSGCDRFHRRGSDLFYKEKISGRSVGHGGWSGDAGVGIPGTVRKAAAILARLLRARHARHADGWTSRQSDYRGRGPVGGRCWGKRLELGAEAKRYSGDRPGGLRIRALTLFSIGRSQAESPGLIPEAVRSLNTELFSGFGAEAFGSPGRSPHYIHGAVADARQLLDARFNLGADVDVLGASLGGQGHFDGDILLRFFRTLEGHGGKIHLGDQAQVDNVDRNLGIVTTL